MGAPVDHARNIGRCFGEWTVLAVERQRERAFYVCRCSCGAQQSVDASSVRDGRSTRCNACANRIRGPQDGHGATRGRTMTAEFRIWAGMLERCSNPRHRAYRRYGGRGITVCERWRANFAAFLADVGPRPSPKHSIDRYPNNDGNYEPGNVRWATDAEQTRNRSSTRHITFRGETLCLKDWATRIGISPAALHERLQRGWLLERALTERAP